MTKTSPSQPIASAAYTAVNLFDAENVVEALRTWKRAEQAPALVTLIEVDGRWSREIGSQMAVAADGRFVG